MMHDTLLWTLSLTSNAVALAVAVDSHRMQRHAHKHAKRHGFHPHIVWRDDVREEGDDDTG